MICTITNCKQEATTRFSPDMDIQGIGACETHVEDVRLAYVALMQGDEDIFKSLIGAKVKKVKPVKRVSQETRSTVQESSSPISNECEDELKLYITSAGDRRRTIYFIRQNFISRKELKEKIEELVSYPASGSRMETEYLVSKSEILSLLNKGGDTE